MTFAPRIDDLAALAPAAAGVLAASTTRDLLPGQREPDRARACADRRPGSRVEAQVPSESP